MPLSTRSQKRAVGGKKSAATKAAETSGFGARRVYDARSVLRFSPELANAVRDDIVLFSDALKKVEAETQKSQER